MKAEENKLLTIEMTNFSISVVKMIVIEYICLAFQNHRFEHDQLKVQLACTNQKIWIHVIDPDLAFDNRTCSCASFVGKRNAFFKNKVNEGVLRGRDRTTEEALIKIEAKLLIEEANNIIDQSVYK